MASDFFQAIADKAEALVDQKARLQGLVERAEVAARKGGQHISLPEFEAFGWGRFEEFLKRLEDSLNSPLLEKVRNGFEDAGIVLGQEAMEKVKVGLKVRGVTLAEIAEQTTMELKTITLAEVQERAKEDVTKLIEESKWDELIQKVEILSIVVDDFFQRRIPSSVTYATCSSSSGSSPSMNVVPSSTFGINR